MKKNHSLAKYTSWKIGGMAEYFYQPADLEDLARLLQDWREEPITILGAATNVLIRDGGVKGLVIYLRDSLHRLDELDNSNLRVEAGVSLMGLIRKCADLGMVDAVRLAGIPGTVGGALKMNAGAYGDCIWNHVVAVETIDRTGKIRVRPAAKFVAGYREVEGLARGEWFVAAELVFTRDDVQAAKQHMQDYLQKRKNSQPLNLPNCGSVFRNPEGDYAARLIEASGLKGRQIGGARVSEKHANFIVNCGNATANDVEMLMQEIVVAVEKNNGIKLRPEVCVLG